VIFMSNRLHPDGTGDVTPLRARVATVAASAVTRLPPHVVQGARWTGRDLGPIGQPAPAPRPPAPPVLTGIDVLRAERLRRAPGPARRARHQPHRHRARRHEYHRPPPRRRRG
jgi:hypothetical protein